MTAVPSVSSSTQSLQQRLAQNQVQPTADGAGNQFLRYDAKRTGEWDFGREREPCTGDVVAIDVSSLKHGYIQWHNKKANKKMVDVSSPLPEPQEPIYYTDAKGKEQVDEAAEARYFEGNFEDGTRVVLEGSTYGMRKAVDAVLGQIFQRAIEENPFLWPHVKLETDSYEHAQYGEVFEPVLEVVAWYDEKGNVEGKAIEAPAAEDEVAEADAPDEAPDEAPAPKRRRRRSAK